MGDYGPVQTLTFPSTMLTKASTDGTVTSSNGAKLAQVGDSSTIAFYGTTAAGAMLTISGIWSAGIGITVEGQGLDNGTVMRTIPYFRMDHGVWLHGEERIYASLGTDAVHFWVPGQYNAMRVTRTSGVAAGSGDLGCFVGWNATMATPMLPQAPGKHDWVLLLDNKTAAINSVDTLVNFTTTRDGGSGQDKAVTSAAASYPIPNGKRLRIRSYYLNFLGEGAGGLVHVTLRSQYFGALAANSNPSAVWVLAPTAGGTNSNERWAGISGDFGEPLDFHNTGLNPSIGISAYSSLTTGFSGVAGHFTVNLYGYLVGY